MIETTVVSIEDDLNLLVDEINRARWDDANDMATYDAPSLRTYLQQPDTLFVTCHEIAPTGRTLTGIASSRFEFKPYGGQRWLYIDEVDVCSDQRQRGAGTAMMRKLFDLARDAGCQEVWLGTELENTAANGLYRSLDPDDVASFVGYAYEVDE